MAQGFISADWYRVADLAPRKRRHVSLRRQVFRGQIWFVLQDHQSGKFSRLTPQGHYVFERMDGKRSLQTLWEEACERFVDAPPSQGDLIQLLSQLYQADIITGGARSSISELSLRAKREKRRKVLALFSNPLALRIPIFDPDRFLNATYWIVAPIFSKLGVFIWVAFMMISLVLAVMHWPELTQNSVERLLAASNIALVMITYPLVKILHELGHAYTTKRWGGEVREVGLMFLLFIPVPYVDASQSSAFESKWQRAAVGAAGILVELTLSAIALIFWLNAEPGLARAFAYNVMLIGSVSTLLFNGNPLLRFDGYYVMADLLEIPNLSQRANSFFWYLFQKFALNVQGGEDPSNSTMERIWMFSYAVLSFLYRMTVMLAIVLLIAGRFLIFGVFLAIWSLFNTLVVPVGKAIRFLAVSPVLDLQRGKAIFTTLGMLLALGFWLLLYPAAYSTVTYGVLVGPPASILRSEADGFIENVQLFGGKTAVQGQAVLQLADPILKGRITLAQSTLEQLRLEALAVTFQDKVQSKILEEQIIFATQAVDNLKKTQSNLIIRAPRAGQVWIPERVDLPGRFVHQGDELGYVWSNAGLTIRVALGQDAAELVRGRLKAVDIRLLRDQNLRIPAHVSAFVPEGSFLLPSPALSTVGGGDILADPSDPQRGHSVDSLFQFDLSPDAKLPPTLIGERVLVHFDHGTEPIGYRVMRWLRQTFLRQMKT